MDNLARDADYKVLIKREDPNQEAGNMRKLMEEESILRVRDFGYSWESMLRFKGITFKSGGTFKLCFCDSSLLPSGSACRTEADYSVEVGTIHASGVSCLIANPDLQRVSCVGQYYGGLRCYRQYGEAPAPLPPPIGMRTSLDGGGMGGGGGAADPSTQCAMMTEEEQADAGFCP